MAAAARETADRNRSNRMVAALCVAFFAGMLGMSFASVPLYRLFCQVTGYGGTTQRVDQYSETILDRTITVRFDANVASNLPWAFRPVQREITIRIGETAKVAYEAANRFSQPTRGRASFNVSPELAGAYFNKVECFCFTDTELTPGETMEMPVVFYVDPAIVDVPELKNLGAITLSYTFFAIDGPAPAAADAAGATGRSTETAGKLGG